jgi:hypothetical protein
VHRIKLSLIFSGLLFLSLFTWNCTKIDTTNIGSGLIPAVDNVFTFADTLPVIAINNDSAGVRGKYLGCDSLSRHRNHALGYIGGSFGDPLFGTTTATIYTQLMPVQFPYYYAVPKDSIGDRNGPHTFDSVVLVLHYVNTWGDSTQTQSVSVYQVNSTTNPAPLRPDSTYTTCDGFPYSTLLGSRTYTPKSLNDTSKVFLDTTTHQLRITITDPTFLNNLINWDSTSNTIGNNAYHNDSAFKSLFAGFAIVPGNSGNAISYFNLDGPNTKLAIYYHYLSRLGTTADPYDTTVAYFRFTPLCGEANQITRNHAGSELAQHQTHPPAGDSLIYIQTSPGTYATLTIPTLDALDNRIIHRAELIVEEVPNLANPLADTLFNPPNYLLLDLKDGTKLGGYRTIPCDYIVTNNFPNVGTFGGYKNTITDALGTRTQYVFNISRFIQNYVTFRRKNVALRLSAPYHVIRNESFTDECGIPLAPFNFGLNEAAQGRVRVGGGNHSKYKMRLHIVYSKL